MGRDLGGDLAGFSQQLIDTLHQWHDAEPATGARDRVVGDGD